MPDIRLNAQNIHLADPEIRIAAKWWADQLRSRTAPNTGDPIGDMIGMWAKSKVGALAAETIDAFERHLVECIKADFIRCAVPWDEANPSYGGIHKTLACDYGPEGPLWEAAKLAGITTPTTSFPWKTVMHLFPGEIKVACGYGAHYETIYPAPESTPTTEKEEPVQAGSALRSLAKGAEERLQRHRPR